MNANASGVSSGWWHPVHPHILQTRAPLRQLEAGRDLLLGSGRTALWLFFSSFIKINLGVLVLRNTGKTKMFFHKKS